MAILVHHHEIQQLLRSSNTIAVVGLSEKPWRDSHTVAAYLKKHGYRIFPVNPNVTSVLGLVSFPTLESIGHKIDIVDIFRRPEHVPSIVESAIAIGARTVWMQSGIIHTEAAERATDAGLDVVMDRCIAVAHTLLVR